MGKNRQTDAQVIAALKQLQVGRAAKKSILRSSQDSTNILREKACQILRAFNLTLQHAGDNVVF